MCSVTSRTGRKGKAERGRDYRHKSLWVATPRTDGMEGAWREAEQLLLLEEEDRWGSGERVWRRKI